MGETVWHTIAGDLAVTKEQLSKLASHNARVTPTAPKWSQMVAADDKVAQHSSMFFSGPSTPNNKLELYGQAGAAVKVVLDVVNAAKAAGLISSTNFAPAAL